jgi:hydroxylaminobenzene mutase
MSVDNGSRQILIHGMAPIPVGLVWGLAVPNTPYPRLALRAHIQFVENGLLFIPGDPAPKAPSQGRA